MTDSEASTIDPFEGSGGISAIAGSDPSGGSDTSGGSYAEIMFLDSDDDIEATDGENLVGSIGREASAIESEDGPASTSTPKKARMESLLETTLEIEVPIEFHGFSADYSTSIELLKSEYDGFKEGDFQSFKFTAIVMSTKYNFEFVKYDKEIEISILLPGNDKPIIRCYPETRDGPKYLELYQFFFGVDYSISRETKPGDKEFSSYVLQRKFGFSELEAEKIATSKDMYTEYVQKVLEEEALSEKEFNNQVKLERNWVSVGQRGMRLVKIVKQITDMDAVILTDVWKGKNDINSGDIRTLYKLYKLEQVRDDALTAEERIENQEEINTFYTSNIGCFKKFSGDLKKKYYDKFSTLPGRKMGEHGYYGQFGFTKTVKVRGRDYLMSTFGSEDVSLLEGALNIDRKMRCTQR